MSHLNSQAPIDAEVRDRARGALDTSMALSAGAGSGKTSVLSDRIVALLAAGRDPARVAAITFTEKAASELRDRVRGSLEKRRHETRDPLLSRAVERFHEMTISTVHGFCRRLLELEPLGSGWAPGTEIVAFDLAGLTSSLAAFRAEARNRDSRLLAIIEEMVSPAQLESAIASLLGSRDLTPFVRPGGIDWAHAHAELVALHRELEDAAVECKKPEDCKLLGKNEALRRSLVDWAADADGGALEALLSSEDGNLQGGKILIDEVQDTDPVQAEIAMWLARDPALEGKWTESAPRPGALFAVGDPKQSIYRFRRADVEVWRDLPRPCVTPRVWDRNARSRAHPAAQLPDHRGHPARRGVDRRGRDGGRAGRGRPEPAGRLSIAPGWRRAGGACVRHARARGRLDRGAGARRGERVPAGSRAHREVSR